MKLIYILSNLRSNPLSSLGRSYNFSLLVSPLDEDRSTDTADVISYVKLVHSDRHISKVSKTCLQNGSVAEINANNSTFKVALDSVALTIEAAKTKNFALCALPGHHASREISKGFCIFNNIAIGTNYLLSQGNRVCVIDFDGHHGDGTESVFKNEERVLFCSLYQSGSYASPIKFKGRKNVISQSINPRNGDEELVNWVSSLEERILSFNPDIIGVSAGFDGYCKDQLLDLRYTLEGFERLGKKIADFKKPTFAVLEGGYHQDIVECASSFIKGFNYRGSQS